MSHWVDDAKKLLRTGQREEGERALRIAIQEDERNVEAWLWLARAVQSDAERITCLLRVMELDPRNATARRTLAALQEKSQASSTEHVDPFKADGMEDAISGTDPFMIGGEDSSRNVEPTLAPPKENPFSQHSEVVEHEGAQPARRFSAGLFARWVIVLLILAGVALIVIVLVLASR